MKAYSAGLMSQSFWFIEFKKVVKLVSDGKSQNDIKAACVEENLLGAVNPYRAKRVAGYLTNRVSTLDAREIQMFIESDLATQKLLNLIAVLRTDRLFFEFLFEVYREKILLGIPVIEDSDTNVFFKNKGAQSNSVCLLYTSHPSNRAAYTLSMPPKVCSHRRTVRRTKVYTPVRSRFRRHHNRTCLRFQKSHTNTGRCQSV